MAQADGSRPAALGVGLVFAALFISTGVSAPYMGLWLQSVGMTAPAIAAILCAPLLARVASGPLIALWADAFTLRRTSVMVLSALAGALFLCLAHASGFWPLLALWSVAATFLAACAPLVDVIALKAAAEGGFPYAVPRGLGSVAYVVGNIAGGALLARFGPKVVVIWISAWGLAASLAARWLLPASAVAPGAAGRRSSERGLRQIQGLLRLPGFLLLIVSAGLIQASHGFYYSFSTLLWRREGLGPGVIGLLWGLGVAVEVGFLWCGEGWRRRIGPERLLILGGLGAVARWAAFAASPPLILLIPLQALHALSFTSTFIASLQLVERLSPAQSASAAQSLNAALYSGLFIGLSTLASGLLYDRLGSGGYAAMAALALLGTAGAVRLERLRIRSLDPF